MSITMCADYHYVRMRLCVSECELGGNLKAFNFFLAYSGT